MADYALTIPGVAAADQTLYRRTDGVYVRPDPADPNFAARAAWLAVQGNVPDAPVETPHGIVVKSTGTPSLNGNYDLDHLQDIITISVYLLANNGFPAGLSPFPWRDAYGLVHNFTAAQWKNLMSALVDYAVKVRLGQNPAQPIIIP